MKIAIIHLSDFHIMSNVTANHTQPFRQTEKDAKIYSQQKN